jgi:hypothetical protein
MENKDIISILSSGDYFSVTTEKVIELEGKDKPYTRLLKVSTYNIKTGEVLLKSLLTPPVPTWWVAIDDKVCRHQRTGALYILAGLDTGEYHAGSTLYYPVDDVTGIIDMDAPFFKVDFKWWLPPKGSFTEGYFCLPFNSIIELLHNVSREGMQQAEPLMANINSLLADRAPLPGLPF